MSKMIIIEKCKDCPFRTFEYNHPLCLKKELNGRFFKIEESEKLGPFPNWCPLRNYSRLMDPF